MDSAEQGPELGEPPEWTSEYSVLLLRARLILDEMPSQNSVTPSSLLHEAWVRCKEEPKDEDVLVRVPMLMYDLLMEHIRQNRKHQVSDLSHRPHEPCQLDQEQPTVMNLLALDAALSRLQEQYPVHAQLVKLRFFGGVKLEDCAATLNLSLRTTDRYWAFARAWLNRDLFEAFKID